ncbi:Uncharacterised protein [Mycobacteroides abscessus subsp. abscessus]|uniref:hypothetical protein n=1 Tax=Mycobacteroides abscessus TaxID=36809 RepID=UPI00092ACA01|nr:hypothetical protein [Mycobacteroides abscessus]SHX95906.1 Uncharacterised protein [Mycobacteroides abscessus subsp. abscessus]SIC76653.1 Uncharacterised protein [Mycobacteroides abscessus subsp. abscessus]SKP28292.1 Uncharacterised protein [Mycobacteroides abscessus subsp. abscessus]
MRSLSTGSVDLYSGDLRAAHDGLVKVLGADGLKGAIKPWWNTRRVARAAAEYAGRKGAFSRESAITAVKLWQQAFRVCVKNAKTGELEVVHSEDTDWIVVTEPLSGIGVRFNSDGKISATGSSKSPPTVFNGCTVDGGGAVAENFLGVGIGRWVYLRGAPLAYPQIRWGTAKAGLRPGSGVEQVRAWLHTMDPYTWAPMHQWTDHSSCQRCGGDNPDETEENWWNMQPGERGSDHRETRNWYKAPGDPLY